MPVYNCDIFLAPIPDKSIHLIITSPPYNVGINYDVHSDTLPYEDYLEWLTRVFVHLKDKLVDGGRLCINIAPTGIKNFTPIHHDLVTNLRKEGYRFVTEILWYKQNRTARTAWGSFMSPSSPYVLPSWEYVYVFQKGEKLVGENPDITKKEFLKYIDGFWEITPEKNKRGHPVPFPEELVYRLIKLYTYPGNTVCDPFGGSGTVAAVSTKCGRKYKLVDISKDYSDIARLRADAIKVECPHCHSTNTEKRGIDRTTVIPSNRYSCNDCKKWFSPSTLDKKKRIQEINIAMQLRDTSKENLEKFK